MKNGAWDNFKKKLTDAKDIKDGTWFTTLLQKVLQHHADNVNGDTFCKKYPGIDKERIAYKLIALAAQKTGISGGAAAAAISAAELAAFETAGATLAVAVGAFVGELSATSYTQLTLIYDISVVLDAPLDANDPEDLMLMFWYALGVNIWEDAANALLVAGPKSATYLGRKVLRSGIRKAMQKVAAKFGGEKLARKLTEKTLLRLAVPGVNIPIAYFANKWFTKKLGKRVLKRLNHRRAALRPLIRLLKTERRFQLLALPTIFQVGICDEAKDISSLVIEMQDTVTRKLLLTEDENTVIEEMIGISFDSFLKQLEPVQEVEAKEALIEIAICSHLFSKAKKESLAKLAKMAEAFGIIVDSDRVRRLEKELSA